MTKQNRPAKTIVLIDPSAKAGTEINWDRIGAVVGELSELYQTVKEKEIDLILVDQSRSIVRSGVALRLRRYNGLCEIWKLTSGNSALEPEDEYIDGTIRLDLGEEGIVEKVEQILFTKDLLARYRIIGRSARMKAIALTINRIAHTEVSVLIEGPSGSGKELVARAIHENSARHGQSFVAVNCGALAEGVLESELFGHEKGAFTGSVGRREGLYSKADKGTIFLDEIGETPPQMQVKLLRVLEDGTYYPVGSSVAHTTDVRVVSATNADLSEAISDRQFREDLYFRIGVVKVVLPPLLERLSDLQPLLQHFWSGHKGMDYSDSAMELLGRYDWPGNVRQLRNFADRMIALKPGSRVDVDDIERFLDEQNAAATHLPVATGKTVEEAGQELIYRSILQLGNEIRLLRDLITSNLPSGSGGAEVEPAEQFEGESTVENMERQLIIQVLAETDGNRKATAKKLGIGERTLYRKLKKYVLE